MPGLFGLFDQQENAGKSSVVVAPASQDMSLAVSEAMLEQDLFNFEAFNPDKVAIIDEKVEFWFQKIKEKERLEAQSSVLARASFWLRDVTEGNRLDDELRQKLRRVITIGEMESSETLARQDPHILEQEAQERSRRQMLRDEQERAYLECLAADKEKEALRVAEEASRQAEEERISKLMEYVNISRPTLKVEPKDGEAEVAKLMFRFPDGTRVQRKFYSSSPIQDVLDFIEFSRIDVSETERGSVPQELFGSVYSLVASGICPEALNNRSLSLQTVGLYPHPALITIKVERL
jgi:hypothetical protein